MQPGRKSRLPAKAREFAHHLQEHVLRYVLGIDIIAYHAAGKMIDARRVIVVDLLGGGCSSEWGILRRRIIGGVRPCGVHDSSPHDEGNLCYPFRFSLYTLQAL